MSGFLSWPELLYKWIQPNRMVETYMERRDFFKKASKQILPLLGLLLIQANKILAFHTESNGCYYSCQNTCLNSCLTMCHEDACKAGCYGGCRQTCMKTCVDLCIGQCKGSCLNSCINLGTNNIDTLKTDTLIYK